LGKREERSLRVPEVPHVLADSGVDLAKGCFYNFFIHGSNLVARALVMILGVANEDDPHNSEKIPAILIVYGYSVFCLVLLSDGSL
jgi:hypothetical protein